MTQTAPGTNEGWTQEETIASIGNYQYGWHDDDPAAKRLSAA